MPLIERIETDMFVFSDVCSYMVNPVNLVGVPGAGLALEFRRRVPEYVERYAEACRTKELRVGTVLVIEETRQPWGIICLPTKRHYVDTSRKEDLVRGLTALRELLQQEIYHYATVGLPMLGCGLGKQDYDVVYPLMQDTLGDLDATVFLSMAPARTELRPRYLTIVGPMDYGTTTEQQTKIADTIDKAMVKWGTSLSEYHGIVSGGCDGVDAFIAGNKFRHEVEKTFVHQRTGKTPLVVRPDAARNGVGANLQHNNLLCEIGDDIILFKPEGHNNNRMSMMQMWIHNEREKRAADGHEPRRLAISGDVGTTLVHEQLLINADMGPDGDIDDPD